MSKQLPLRLDRGWGGRRSGAGRKPGPNPRIRHRSRARFERSHPCHVTLKVRADVPSLRSVAFVRAFGRAFAGASERKGARLVHYSLQNDHVHLIVEAAGPVELGRAMKSFAARFALAVNRVFGRRGAVLADRYHVRPLRTPREVRNALAYVLLNSRRHAPRSAKRAAARVALDPASSGRWFDGWSRAVAAAPGARVVCLPHSWLLRVGWRRHGLLDPAEIPGPDVRAARGASGGGAVR